MEKKQTHVPYGFISGIAMVIFGLTLYFTGVAFNPGMQYVPYIPFLVGIILNATAYSKANGTNVTFGNVFGSCFKATMIVTIVMVAWGVISVYLLPDMKVKALAMIREAMYKSSQKLSDEQIDKIMDTYNKYWTYIVVAITILSSLVYGAIFSLIGALVAKKNPAPRTADNF